MPVSAKNRLSRQRRGSVGSIPNDKSLDNELGGGGPKDIGSDARRRQRPGSAEFSSPTDASDRPDGRSGPSQAWGQTVNQHNVSTRALRAPLAMSDSIRKIEASVSPDDVKKASEEMKTFAFHLDMFKKVLDISVKGESKSTRDTRRRLTDSLQRTADNNKYTAETAPKITSRLTFDAHYGRQTGSNLALMRDLQNYIKKLSGGGPESLELSYKLGKRYMSMIGGNKEFLAGALRKDPSHRQRVSEAPGESVGSQVRTYVDEVQNEAGIVSGTSSVVGYAVAETVNVESEIARGIASVTGVTAGLYAGITLGATATLSGLYGLGTGAKATHDAKKKVNKLKESEKVRKKLGIENIPFGGDVVEKLQSHKKAGISDIVIGATAAVIGIASIGITAGASAPVIAAAAPAIGAGLGAAGVTVGGIGTVKTLRDMARGRSESKNLRALERMQSKFESGSKEEIAAIRAELSDLLKDSKSPDVKLVRNFLRAEGVIDEKAGDTLKMKALGKFIEKHGEDWKTFLAKSLLHSYQSGDLEEQITAAAYIADIGADITQADAQSYGQVVVKIRDALSS